MYDLADLDVDDLPGELLDVWNFFQHLVLRFGNKAGGWYIRVLHRNWKGGTYRITREITHHIPGVELPNWFCHTHNPNAPRRDLSTEACFFFFLRSPVVERIRKKKNSSEGVGDVLFCVLGPFVMKKFLSWGGVSLYFFFFVSGLPGFFFLPNMWMLTVRDFSEAVKTNKLWQNASVS